MTVERIILNLVKSKKKISYHLASRVARVSPNYAREIMKGMAEFYPDLEYQDGSLIWRGSEHEEEKGEEGSS